MNTHIKYLIDVNTKAHRSEQSDGRISELAKKNALLAKIETIEKQIQSLANEMDDLIDLRTKLLNQI